MSKKFDVVIGNPPYQEEAQDGRGRDMPIYHLFMDAAYEVGKKAVLITPARFLFNAGFTPKPWNRKMLADPHLTVPIYVRDSSKLFPGTKIRAGIAVTYRDEERDGEPIVTFTSYPELNTILHKVLESSTTFIDGDVSSGRAYSFTQAMHDANPDASRKMSDDAQFRVSTNAFDQLAPLFHANQPDNGDMFVRLLGVIKNKRVYRWIRSDYIAGPESFGRYKVAVPAANESNTLGQMATPQVLEPGVGVTQTFLTIGAFETKGEAQACFSYIKTKFARAMLYVLKVTQHNPRSTWKFVPLQDFTASSDIDWSKSVAEIDQQLYKKYGLDDDEITFLESKVKTMG